MASGNVDLPDDLFITKPVEEVWAGKDQVNPENNIPLSPQWLYAKHGDSKDTRPPSSLPSGTLSDSIQKDIWRLDGSQDKKEWRKNVSDIDSSRRWREEERETSLLSRRERKKEGEREIEYRKGDRRPENAVVKEPLESRTLSSTERLHEVPNRGMGNENRRDSKWSSRWGPEDKDKESRIEKKVEVEKEDSHTEKQSFSASLRSLSGTDSRDKWRPRHRQDVHSGGSSVRAAPGFGFERDRVDGSSNSGFARGRGRSNSVAVLQLGSSFAAASSIGAIPVTEAEFCYPRGKLLAIYRKQKTVFVDATPVDFEDAPPVTTSSFVTPLAFDTPDAEEEILLKEIWKGKVNSIGANLSQEKMAKTNEADIGDEEKSIIEKKHDKMELIEDSKELNSEHGQHKDITVDSLINLVGLDGLSPKVVNHDVFLDKPGSLGADVMHSETDDGMMKEINVTDQSSHLDIFKNVNLGDDFIIPFDVGAKVPVKSCPVFDIPHVEVLNNNKFENRKLENKLPHPEELSLYYQDPQGDVQGPFLGFDIISWFEQGFFGTDLPVCLSDAPEGTPFQPLGEVMPHLKLELHPISNIFPGEKSETFDATSHEHDPTLISGSFASKDQQQTLTLDALGSHLKLDALENETLIDSNNARLPFSKAETSLRMIAEGHNLPDFTGQDAEVVLYKGRSSSNMEKQQHGKVDNHNIALSMSMGAHHSMLTETANTSFAHHNLQRGNDMNPLGLFWSELKGNQNKPLSSTIPGSMENLIGNYDHARTASPFNLNQEQQLISGRDLPNPNDSWSKNYRWSSSARVPDNLGVNNISRFEDGPNHPSLEQSLLLQQLQKQQLQHQLQQQSLLAHQNADLSGTYLDRVHELMHQHPVNQQSMEDLEQMLKLRFEQQVHLEQLQQQQLQQQQLQRQRQLHQHFQYDEPQFESQRQIYLENLLHQQLLEPGTGLSNVYPHDKNMMDQMFLRQQLLNESRKHSSNLSHESVMEQLIHANQGLNFQQQNKDLFNVLSHSKLRQMSLEQQYLLEHQLEQLQAQQLSASRNLTGIEEERHRGGIWSVDESGQFIRTAASQPQNYSSRLGQLDFLQKSQGPSLVEHPSHSQRNYLLQERMQRGLHPLDSSMHMPRAGTSPPNMELINAIARGQGLDAQDHLDQLHASGQMGQFHSNFHAHQRQISREFSGTHMDPTESHWSDLARQVPADLIESQLKQLQIKAEKQRGANMNVSFESPNAWAPNLGNNESSKYELRDLLHQEMLHQSQQSLSLVDGAATSSYEQKDPSWLYSRPNSENPYDLNRERAALGGVFSDASLLEQVGRPLNEQIMNTIDNKFESSNRFTLKPGFSTSFEQKQFPPDLDLFERGRLANSLSDASLQLIDFSNLKDGERGKMQDISGSSRIQSMMDAQESRVMQAEGHDGKSFKQDLFEITSLGFFDYEAEFVHADKEEMPNNMAYGDPKAADSFLKRAYDLHDMSSARPPHDMPSARPPSAGTLQISKGHDSATYGSSEEVQQEPGATLSSQSSEVLRSNKKDFKFRRTSSSNDTDTIEPSFSDMLKSTKKSMPEHENIETGSVGKSSKKKGKKGRQIDPSLLGFKVHSNRILMGEIQRPDD
ncbi:protein ESSENTIAL FOR POTEXVIRUS ACCUMULATION 1-like isoform X2 [Zingiber officinale]|uniref:protein ESSENTIAL FOR POTEXVIRUS ACCUMULATION 1-like isoform X2 n=1 Tax=Zingiber officinale TaxID=94328 RepID=UPI001C4D776A|nr:protein ESSENTIAL FOR POTEXVIRUS ACCUMULATION 1-like isoform X2 [Zingiber officinale]